MARRARSSGADDYKCLTIDPLNPSGDKSYAIIPGSWYIELYKHSPVEYENLRCVKVVLEDPQRIFYGPREYNEGGWCMTGRPLEWHVKSDVVRPFPPDLVFAVYLNPHMRVYEARAEFAADDDRLAPIDWMNRYKGRIAWSGTF